MTPNPLLYVLGFTVVMALGTGLWKVFWWVAKVDAGERDFRAFTKEIREDIKRILLRLDPTLHEPDGDATASGRAGPGAAVSLASDKRGYVNQKSCWTAVMWQDPVAFADADPEYFDLVWEAVVRGQ